MTRNYTRAAPHGMAHPEKVSPAAAPIGQASQYETAVVPDATRVDEPDDSRLSRSDALVSERATHKREHTENRHRLSDEEFNRRIRKNQIHGGFPSYPPLPGWHTFWASTELRNPDNVLYREQLGYRLVKAMEVPGHHAEDIKTGTYEGCIGFGDLVLMKIEDSRYQMLMDYYHNELPHAASRGIIETAMSQLVHNDKSMVFEQDTGGGTKEMMKARPKPKRFE